MDGGIVIVSASYAQDEIPEAHAGEKKLSAAELFGGFCIIGDPHLEPIR